MAAARPSGTSDHCLLSSDATQSVKVIEQAQCNADKYLVPHLSPRQEAGGARTEDVLKCQLQPMDMADYGGKLSTAQTTRLQAVFPGGVCDWSRPGVGQQDSVSPLNFKAGPGGQPFSAEPVSMAK